MVGSMVFNEGEAQRLIEILSEKAGVIQDTWHKVGPPFPGRVQWLLQLAWVVLPFPPSLLGAGELQWLPGPGVPASPG